MSEAEKKHRSVQEIQNEYQQLCCKAGHLQYGLKCHKDDLALLNDQLRELNQEAVAAQNVAAEEAKKQAQAQADAEAIKAAAEKQAPKKRAKKAKESENEKS